MGHYDDQYEETYAKARAANLKAAQIQSRKSRLPLLADSHFVALGICRECADKVYSIPNWGCVRLTCPHKP